MVRRACGMLIIIIVGILAIAGRAEAANPATFTITVTLDSTNPTVDTFSPTDNAIDVGVNANLVLTFSEAVDVESGNITIKKTSDNSEFETISVTDATKVTGTGTNTITIDPAGTFVSKTEYYVLIDADCFDDTAGNSYAGISSTTDWSFTTADVVAPTITSGTLAADNTYVDILMSEGVYNTSGGTGGLEATDFSLTFTQNAGDATNASIATVTRTDGGALTGGETTIRANLTITGTPSGVETVEIKAVATSIYDASGNAMLDTQTTGALTLNDQANPIADTFSPTDNAIDVGVNANLVLTFSEAVDVESGNITIKKTSDNSEFETISVTDATKVTGTGTNTITIDPAGTFVSKTEYYVLIDADCFDDTAGNSYAGISSTTDWSFTTADVVAPTITVTISSDNADTSLARVDDTVTLTIVASEDIGTPTVTIDSNAADAVTQGADAQYWTATRQMQEGDTEGTIGFTIDFKDLADNSGTQVTATTDASSVTFSPNTAAILNDGTTGNTLPALTQATDGSGKIAITFKIKDAEGNNCSVVDESFQYQVNAGDWTNILDADITGTKTGLASATDMSGATHTLTWDNSREYIDNNVYSNVKIRFKVNDGTDDSAYGLSPTGFNVDNSNLAGTDTVSDMVDGKTVTITKSDDTTSSTSAVDIPIYGSEATADATVSITVTNNGTTYYTGEATADATGSWTTDTISWRPGRNTVTVTIGGAAHSYNVDLIDPEGIIYDALTGDPITGAEVSIYDATTDTLATGIPGGATQTTSADGAYNFLVPAGTYYLRVTVAGYTDLLPGSSIITVPAGNGLGTTSGSVDDSYTDIYYGADFSVVDVPLHFDIPLDPDGAALFSLAKTANKKEVVVGEVVTYTLTITSNSTIDITGLRINDRIPAGFKYIKGKALLNGSKASDPTGTRNLYFNLSTLSAGSITALKYQLVVGSGVVPGKYSNTAYLERQGGSSRLSNRASVEVEVVLDPMFDLGTVIGKVFWDRNENGIQDKAEEPIPNLQIVMEDGTVITAGKDGKYHSAGIIPGRHLFRLDERTLPEEAYLTTDKVVIVDITPGILAKVNFGVNLQGQGQKTEIPVKITQERGKPEPRLNVALRELGPSQYEFRIFTNYLLFMRKWKLEILDKDTNALIKKFEGGRLNINKPIYWDGKTDVGRQITESRNYFYRLIVFGAGGKKDITRERDIKVGRKETENREQKTETQIAEEHRKWLEQESKLNNLEKQTIRIEGETIRVIGPKYQSIKVLKERKVQAEIPVIESEGLTAKELSEDRDVKEAQSQNEIEVILPRGEYSIEVHSQQSIVSGKEEAWFSSANQQSTEKDSLSTMGYGPLRGDVFSKNITIGDDYLFFVAMGDAKMGYTFKRGDIEPAQHDDKFKEGYWSEGKLAYYLKGKIKGKYLITSSLDTERDKKELFRNLDPDKYYPVYGDSSSINYDATDTQGMLYLLIEWDKSSVLWGDYLTGFSDTELAAFNRTLYGGRLHLESVSTTQFGEPQTKLILFHARAQQRAAHNEFVGSGGSLFYLKNKDIIEGSVKVKIEVRDKITGLISATKEKEDGLDYEID